MSLRIYIAWAIVLAIAVVTIPYLIFTLYKSKEAKVFLFFIALLIVAVWASATLSLYYNLH
jgi:hypothetical protein